MRFLKNLLFYIGIAGIGLFLADYFIPEVSVEKTQTFLSAGAFLGLMNLFIRPLIKIVTLPLRIITLGLFSLVINAFLIWLTQAIFPEVDIDLFLPLLYTTLIIWILEFTLHFCAGNK